MKELARTCFEVVGFGLLVCCMVYLAGCATLQLPKDATPEQKHEAHCKDAKAYLKMAQSEKAKAAVGSSLLAWWELAEEGAQSGVASYCGE